MRKLNRKRRLSDSAKRSYPVLIVKPHKKSMETCEETSQFLSRAFQRGIAEYRCTASDTPDLARNEGIHQFLHNPQFKDKTHIFFVDDDSTPCNDFVIERLLSFRKPVIAGVTPIVRRSKTTLDCMWSAVVKDESGKMQNIGIDELPKRLFKAHRIGGTCVLIRRNVLEKIKPPYQKFEFNESQTDVVRSEDMYFSDKIREAGFDIWIDPESECHHFHRWDLLDLFAIARQAKAIGRKEALSEC